MPRHRSSAVPLAWLYAALIAYASLYPFMPWRLPGGSPFAFLALPWPRYWTAFDLVANLLGYIPLGALIFGSRVRGGSRGLPAFRQALACGVGLSLTMELLQNFLPHRVPSNLDLATNGFGTLIGAALGWRIHRRGGVERWQAARDRWFIGRSAGGLALLLLWPVGLLYPLPVPLGQGQVLMRLREGAARLLADTLIAPWFAAAPGVAADPAGLSPHGEFALIALGLLVPCVVAFTVSNPGWRRIVLVIGALVLGCLVTTLSTALNFGPDHLLAWGTPEVAGALALGAAVAVLAVPLPQRAVAAFGLVALFTMVVLVTLAPSDPFFAQRLQTWEQGRFVRFHGLARWVGWCWPYAAILYLLTRLRAGDATRPAH